MNGVARRASVLLVVGLLFGACSLEYDETRLASETSEDTPDTVLFEVTSTIVRDGSPRFIVEAGRAETFSRIDRQFLSEVRFQEIGPDGSVVTDGVADYAEYQTDTEDFELTGGLRFYSAGEDAWLSADYLYWDSDSRLLTSEPEHPVIVERADGTSIRGRGFVAEMGRSIIRFEGGVSGTLVEDENPE
ncbi:MAG: LPS export ABC transporter periplasmic protein LptC [Spirochaetota bacterium]